MSNETEKDPVLSDKLYKRGYAVFNIGFLLFAISNCISQEMNRRKWEILIGEKFFNNYLIFIFFIIVPLIGGLMCLVACKRNKSKYASRYVTVIVVYLLLLIMLIAFSISSTPISSSYEEVNLPNDKTVTLICEEQPYVERLIVCDVHWIFAKKVTYTIIPDHNYNCKFDYDENDDTYSITIYYENSNEKTIPSTDKFKLK